MLLDLDNLHEQRPTEQFWGTFLQEITLENTSAYLKAAIFITLTSPVRLAKRFRRFQPPPFIELVDRILAITKDEDYLSNPAKQAKVKEYERQIDQMVYELYGLTPEEIEIVEGKN